MIYQKDGYAVVTMMTYLYYRKRCERMKRVGNLYDKFISEKNFADAFKEAMHSNGDSEFRALIKCFYSNHQSELLHDVISYAENFEPFEHKVIKIYENSSKKTRGIVVPTINEVILHHAVIQVLEPIFMKSMYQHSYASIPGRGGLAGKKALDKMIKNDFKNTRYFLKMDIRKFFDSIDQNVLIDKLQNKIKDKKMMEVLAKIISTTDSGIPLGFYTSQWFANFLLTELDHLITEKWGAKHYIRYMDDMVVLGSNKQQLKEIKDNIENYLNNELHLELKNNVIIAPLMYVNKKGKICGRDIDFLGYRFYRDHVTIRNHIMNSIIRKTNKIEKCMKEKRPINPKLAMSMLSYYGWIKHTDSFKFFCKHVKHKAPPKLLKQVVKEYRKRQRKRNAACPDATRIFFNEDKIEKYVKKHMVIDESLKRAVIKYTPR